MKKILFIVCTHGNELAGLKLFFEHPYGRNKKVQWDVIVGNPLAASLNTRFYDEDLNRAFFQAGKNDTFESRRALDIARKMQDYDVVYDIHQTRVIKPSTWEDSIFVNKVDKETLDETRFVRSKNIIWDSKVEFAREYSTYYAKVGITLEYQKTDDVVWDYERIHRDFESIVSQKRVGKPGLKTVYEADRPVTHDEREKYNLRLTDFIPLTIDDKHYLNLPLEDNYVPVFVNERDEDPNFHAFLNKKKMEV